MNMTPPSPKHRLYVKVNKPHVKRWIKPDVSPDPERWILADEAMPAVSTEPKKAQAPAKPKTSEVLKAAELDGLPEIPVEEEAAQVEAKPKTATKKPGRPKKAAAKKTKSTKKDAE